MEISTEHLASVGELILYIQLSFFEFPITNTFVYCNSESCVTLKKIDALNLKRGIVKKHV